MKIKIHYLIFTSIFLFTSCSKEPEYDFYADFYSNANTSATTNDLIGTWAIFNIEFDENKSQVPINYQECGRDYLVFEENGVYKEYLYQSNNCDFTLNTLSWELNQGIITLSNQQNESDEAVITKLNSNELIFKSKFDIDDDGNLEIFKAYLKPYTPIEIDVVSETFNRNLSPEYRNLISYIWQPYQGNEEFVSYDIYRSSGANCSKNNAVLIETITDSNITIFTDLTPPAEERLCYFLKVNIKSKTLGESDIQSIDTYTLEASYVNLEDPKVINNTIHLNWEKSDMPYFSHYEISYSNFPPNITGYGQQIVSVVKITNINSTSFIDENPPYLENPFYKINVYDIFGNKTYDYTEGYKTYLEVDFRRDEIINLNNIQSYANHQNKPIVYFLGAESGSSYSYIHKYNYETNTTEVISDKPVNISTELPIEFFNTTYGEEVFLAQGSVLEVYDANTLEFKYELKFSQIYSIDDFLYTSSGFWFFTDGDYIFSFSRDNDKLILIDKKLHFSAHQSGYNYSVVEIKNNQLLLGHKNEAYSILYAINTDGFLTQTKTIDIIIDQDRKRNMQFNIAENFIINYKKNKVYSSDNFSVTSTFPYPNFSSGISKNGKEIYGSNNDENWNITDDSKHEKKAVVYNRETQLFDYYITKGYSHVIFEDFQGKIISISSGMKKEGLFRKINNKEDLFIEVIE
ncbi:lipocalin family protein [Polaribacter sp. Hel1_85]|uniref:lipocalin family protein n=1 Tax=Polaribacter sp. Hel1_85 TaxID=1250005 RepID=UPI00052B8940|nr:lipocalin family protein [Polaribacter sp. Hel1_85]KGL63821.1 hypothetical protein PHEL85_0862 [Polaribacter sp. Hel1_85]